MHLYRHPRLIISYLNEWTSANHTAFLNSFDECVSSSVISDRESKSLVAFRDLDFFCLTWNTNIWSMWIWYGGIFSINALPFMWAKMKSSSPICPPSNIFMSILWVFSVQKRIWNREGDRYRKLSRRTMDWYCLLAKSQSHSRQQSSGRVLSRSWIPK